MTLKIRSGVVGAYLSAGSELYAATIEPSEAEMSDEDILGFVRDEWLRTNGMHYQITAIALVRRGKIGAIVRIDFTRA